MDKMDGMDFMDPAWEQARACDGFLSIWAMPSISSIFPKCHFPRRAERTR